MGHADGAHPGGAARLKELTPAMPIILNSRHPRRQAGDKEHLRTSARLQDAHARTDVCLDVQPQDEGEGLEVGHCMHCMLLS